MTFIYSRENYVPPNPLLQGEPKVHKTPSFRENQMFTKPPPSGRTKGIQRSAAPRACPSRCVSYAPN